MKRKLTAFVLALVLALAAISAPAYAAKAAYQQTIPHINIHGFMCCPLYSDKNDPNSEQIWPPQGDSIKDAVFDLIPGLFKYIFTHNHKEFMGNLCDAINSIFGPLMCDSSGDPIVKGSGAYLPRPTKEEVLANPTIELPYDWRLDPYEAAKTLNEFINYLTDELGFGQVVVECHSNGGTILMTYFSVYGTEKVRSCCFSATAVYGAGFAAELIEGRINIFGDGLTEFLKGTFYNKDKAKIIIPIINICSKLGIINGVSGFLNKLLKGAHDEFYSDSVIPIFGKWLNIWAMVPDDSVDGGKAYVKNHFGLDSEGEYKNFFEKVDNYTENIRKNRESILEEINKNCNLYVFSFYDSPGIPIAADWSTMSDGVLYSADAAFGAKFKDYGSADKFVPGKYVSPDGLCDGSDAKFRDQTWYFRNVNHLLKCDYLNEIAKTLLYYDGQATVETFDEYPQFLKYDINLKNIILAK